MVLSRRTLLAELSAIIAGAIKRANLGPIARAIGNVVRENMFGFTEL